MGKGKKRKAGNQPVHEHVQELLASWNPAPVDNAIERLVGIPPDPGDVAATAHVRDPRLDHDRNPALDSVDAAQMYADDGDGDGDDDVIEDYTGDDWDHAALKDEIDKRNEGRDDDATISKGGSSDDLRERLIEDDVNQRVENDDDEDDDGA